jgi:hypothetical protein
MPVIDARSDSWFSILGVFEPLHPAFQNEAADAAASARGFRPDHEHVGDRRIEHPGLGARDDIVTCVFARVVMPPGSGSRIGFISPETADEPVLVASFGRWLALLCSSRALIGITRLNWTDIIER